jgi:hypothetical protein
LPRGVVYRRRAALRQVTRRAAAQPGWRAERSGAAARRVGSGCGHLGEGLRRRQARRRRRALDPIELNSAVCGKKRNGAAPDCHWYKGFFKYAVVEGK